MSKTTGVILAALVITVVTIAIGYANLSDEVLQIKGTVSAQAVNDNFKVEFGADGVVKSQPEREEGEECTITTTKTGPINATFSVEGLQVAGDTVTVEYTIVNNSTGIVATNVRAEQTSEHVSNDYITTTIGTPSKTTLNPGDEATVLVTTTLEKTPLSTQSQTVGLQILATPSEAE